ncbi:MAG: head GIN domain-containing protein [Bacteroidota bacterium]
MKINMYVFKFIVITLITLFTASCNMFPPKKGSGTIIKTDKELAAFTKISLEGAFNVFISPGEKAAITIETDDNLQQYITAKVRSNKLTIKTKRDLLPSKEVNIYLTVANIESIEASGAVIVKSNGKISADKFALDLSGASNVALDINCVDFNAEMNGSSKMKLIGAASMGNINVSGASDMYNFDMLFDNLKLKIKGAAKAQVNVITQLDVTVMGAGEVLYMGTPDVKKSISGGGKVDKVF